MHSLRLYIKFYPNFEYQKVNKMKNIKYLHYSCIVAVFVTLISCDTGFDAMNTHPTALTSVDPAFQLNNAISASAPDFTHAQCETSIVKQHMRIFSGVGACGNFNQNSRPTHNWSYTNQVRNLLEVINVTADDPDRVNLYNMARIWMAYTIMITTDSHGDIPYSEAGRALEGLTAPVYDTQENIYAGPNGILEEFRQATAGLNSGSPTVSTDLLYAGDITKWQRLGNSLLLRAAMRLVKIAPDIAEEYVGYAVNGPGGLMQSNEDNALLRHNSQFQNGPGNSLNGGQAHFNYLVEDFVEFLKNTNDPRLEAISVRYPGAMGSTDQWDMIDAGTADISPENQVGIPMGYDNVSISGPIDEDDRVSSLFAYSQVDRTRMMTPFAPSFLVTYAHTSLLQAEAVVREWITGDAAVLYASAVEAHMHQFAHSDYGPGTAIDQNDIDTYIQENPLEVGQELEQINNQYWVASFMIGPEAFANFRRSGYPDLAPNPFPVNDLTSEPFMRRFAYPERELSVNTTNVQAAIQRQEGDAIDTRIWWDVPE